MKVTVEKDIIIYAQKYMSETSNKEEKNYWLLSGLNEDIYTITAGMENNIINEKFIEVDEIIILYAIKYVLFKTDYSYIKVIDNIQSNILCEDLKKLIRKYMNDEKYYTKVLDKKMWIDLYESMK